jgi:large subunit ribosomal protein L10
LNREEKASIVQELSDKFARAKIAIVTDYRGLTVTELEELRVALRKSDSEVRVAKNTLLRRAVEGTPFEPMNDHFKGTSALTVSYADPVGPAKALVDFAKIHERLLIRTAVMDGKLLSPEDLVALSKLPSKEILLSQLLSVMQAVPTGFVRVLNGVPQKLVYALQAIKDQKEQ